MNASTPECSVHADNIKENLLSEWTDLLRKEK